MDLHLYLYFFRGEGNQGLTGMCGLHLEQLSPKHNVAVLSGKFFLLKLFFEGTEG